MRAIIVLMTGFGMLILRSYYKRSVLGGVLVICGGATVAVGAVLAYGAALEHFG